MPAGVERQCGHIAGARERHVFLGGAHVEFGGAQAVVTAQSGGEYFVDGGQGRCIGLYGLHVEACGVGELQQACHGHEGELVVAFGVDLRELVAGELSLGLEHVELGYLSGVEQLASTLELGAREVHLVGGHVEHLAAVEHLQILADDVERNVVLRGFVLLDDGAQSGLGIVEPAHTCEALEYGHVQPHLGSEALRVAVGVGVVAGEAAAEREVLRRSGRYRGQEAVLGLRHAVFGREEVDGALAHADIVLVGIGYAAVEAPCSGMGTCGCGCYGSG